jgi:hypothetical protein
VLRIRIRDPELFRPLDHCVCFTKACIHHTKHSFGIKNRELHNDGVPSSNFRTGQIVYREVRKNTACIMRKKQKGKGERGRGKGEGGGVAKQQQDPTQRGLSLPKTRNNHLNIFCGYKKMCSVLSNI